jgi:hypothetical protein
MNDSAYRSQANLVLHHLIVLINTPLWEIKVYPMSSDCYDNEWTCKDKVIIRKLQI